MVSPAFNNILLPVDFSTFCDEAAAYAAWFAAKGGTVHLVHVISNPYDSIYEPQATAQWGVVNHAEARAKALLESYAGRCLPGSCPRTFHLLHGDPFEKLMKLTATLGPDLIVMSTRGRGGLAHLLIGSVAEKVVRHALCPVFVVHRRADTGQGGADVSKETA